MSPVFRHTLMPEQVVMSSSGWHDITVRTTFASYLLASKILVWASKNLGSTLMDALTVSKSCHVNHVLNHVPWIVLVV